MFLRDAILRPRLIRPSYAPCSAAVDKAELLLLRCRMRGDGDRLSEEVTWAER